MKDIVKILPNFKKFNEYINDVKKNISPIMLSGLTDVAKTHFAYSTSFYTNKPICIITYNELEAKKILKDLDYFTKNIDFFPKRDIVTYDYVAESKDTLYTRINALNNIYSNKSQIIVTTIEAIMQKIVSRKSLYKNLLNFKVGDIVDLEKIKQQLISLGYERCEMADTKSQFCVRGGIIDIVISEKQGVRIELWGDEIDSIRFFDTMSQKSNDKTDKITIYPTYEFILEKDIEEIIKKIGNDENSQNDIEQIKEGNYLSKIDKYFDKFYEKQESFLDYLDSKYIIFLDEVSKIKARCENILKDNNILVKTLVEKKKQIPDSLKNLSNYLEILNKIKEKQIIYLEKQDVGFVDQQSMTAKRNGYSFSYREVNFFRSSMDLLLEEIEEAAGNKTIVILSGNKDNITKIEKLLCEKNPKIEQYIKTTTENPIIFDEGELSTGFECYDFNLLVVSIANIFETKVKRKRISKEFQQGETVIFSELKPR